MTPTAPVDAPLTLKAIQKHIILVIIGFFVLTVLTSFISVNAFIWNTKSDIRELKANQEQTISDNKTLTTAINNLTLEIANSKTPTSLNSQEIIFLKQGLDKMQTDLDLMGQKLDKTIQFIFDSKTKR